MKSPARYEGTFMFGVSGSWWIEVCDSLWPDESDSTARFEYLWGTFFADNYDSTPGAEGWLGRFDMPLLSSRPSFGFNLTSPAGHVGGNGYLIIRVRDDDADEILSQSEKHGNDNLNLYFTLDPYECTGSFAGKVGSVSASSGNLNFVNPPQSDALQIMGQMMANDATGPVVSNVVASQRTDSMLVDVTYDLYHPESLLMVVNLAVSDDNGLTFGHECSELTGDVGIGVLPGQSRAAVWDAGQDYPSHAGSSFVIRVTADDGRLSDSASTYSSEAISMPRSLGEPGGQDDR